MVCHGRPDHRFFESQLFFLAADCCAGSGARRAMCCFCTARDARSDHAAPDQARYATGPRFITSRLRWTREGGGDGRAGRSDNDPIMCRCNRGDGAWASASNALIVTGTWPTTTLAHVPARRLSDQDIMPRYRMTPPGRGRCPASHHAERCNVRQRERRQRRAEQHSLLRRAPLPQRTWE